MELLGSSFLHERDPKLHATPEIQGVVDYLRANGEAIPNQPAEKITAYLGFLANSEYVNDGIMTGDPESIDRQVEAHVIKSDDVPESYFALQRRIARERGQGDVEITDEMRGQLVEAMQSDQHAGLHKWVEYLGGRDGGYPNWFKYYTWNSLTKLGAFDKQKGEFIKRSRGTTAPYPELNREALAYVYDALNKKVEGEKVEGGEPLQKLLKSGNFSKLYAHAIFEVTPASEESKKEIRGSWTKFNQTEDPRTSRRLSESLQGHGTGWCTAGESTSREQLSKGDFYVYYTRDEEGKDTVPRVAIRMEDGEVTEVRGINYEQNLEPVMLDTANEKLKDLPGGEAYRRRTEDMQRLTQIEKKIMADPGVELSESDLRFLYQFDRPIEGFGYEPDPRIDELRLARGERDADFIAQIIKEKVREQLTHVAAGNRVVSQSLGLGEGLTDEQLQELFAAKEAEWQKRGVYDYLTERFLQFGTKYNLIATPNVLVEPAKIKALIDSMSPKYDDSNDPAYSFRELQHSYDVLFEQFNYTASELSGGEGDSPVKLLLIPDKSESKKEMAGKNAMELMTAFKRKKEAQSNLGLRVPTVLDAVTLWSTIDTSKLDFETCDEATYITHFNVRPRMGRQRLGGEVALQQPETIMQMKYKGFKRQLSFRAIDNIHAIKLAIS